ncbi:MAG: terminase [Alphaproteobacteria bacterium]|nr:MAG: terminase [Alphaproteobacteria bacterium]
MSSANLKSSALKRALALAREQKARASEQRLKSYRPYSKQRAFHEAGIRFEERMFMAANQVGKTTAGAAEWAIHLTGLYPEGWKGKRFKKPVRFWAAGVTSQSTRDNPQRLLIGPPADESAWGTAMIPKAHLADWTRARGIANALDTVLVAHVSGGFSTLAFKSYEMGRAKWQGETLDGVWFDEEPPLDIYSEGLTRTQASGLFSILTFTPLQGASEVVRLFLEEEGPAPTLV